MDRRQFLQVSLTFGAALTLATSNQARAATTHKVKIRGFKFSPRKLEVAVGDSIEFENRDSAAHTATATDNSWDTGTLGFGEKATIPVTDGMKTSYFCRFHAAMKGSLVVSG